LLILSRTRAAPKLDWLISDGVPRRINLAQEFLDLGGDARLHPPDRRLRDRPPPTSTASGSTGWSIVRSRENLRPSTFLPIAIRCSAFIAGERTFRFWTSRSKPSPILPVRTRSWSE